jgi:hypothetical protein
MALRPLKAERDALRIQRDNQENGEQADRADPSVRFM